MNAMAVPPSGWNPYGSPEPAPVRGTSRRSVGQGLALSAVVHLSALACILWVQAQHPVEEVILTHRPVDLVPPYVDRGFPPPVVPIDGTTQPEKGTIDPTSQPVDRVDLPKVDASTGFTRPGVVPGPAGNPGTRDVSELPAAVNPDPPENAFIAYDEPPVPIVRPDPAYPEWARENGIEGRIVLHALVGTDGRVRRVTVRQGIPGLSESAEDALYRWTFRPAMAGRQPVAVWIEVPFRFHL